MNSVNASTSRTFYGLDMPSLLNKLGVPGCSVAVLDGDEIVEERAFGVRSGAEAVTPRTMFQAGSISKPVSVFGALRLVERGELSLDADVNDQLVRWKVPPVSNWQPRVTLRQLASHTAGLTTHGFPGYAAGSPLPSLEQILAGIAPANSQGVRPDLMPGLHFRYSGGGTMVMQLLMETVTGKTTPDLLDELVLSPLGMTSSTFAQPLPAKYENRAAHGYRTDGSPIPGRWHTQPELCAAGLWTTPADLLRFVRGIQDATYGRANALLSTDTAHQMLSPQTTVPGHPIQVFNAYGLGPYLHLDDGVTTWFGHDTWTAGFKGVVIANRTGQGAAVMTNGEAAGMVAINQVFEAVAREYGWQGFELGYACDPIMPPDLGTLAGAYITGSGIRVELSTAPDTATITVGNQSPVRVSATSATELIADGPTLIVRCETDDAITLEQSGQATTCTRLSEQLDGDTSD